MHNEYNTSTYWDIYYLQLLEFIKKKSKDPSTKVGAVIVGKHHQVISQGFNGFAIGVDDNIDRVPERFERPDKYQYTIHAELNAITLSCRHGISLEGCRIYSSLYPCPNCANAIVQSGIKSVVTFSQSDDDITRLAKDFNFHISGAILREAGIEVVKYNKERIMLHEF